MERLAGRTAIVTGPAVGLGRAAVRLMTKTDAMPCAATACGSTRSIPASSGRPWVEKHLQSLGEVAAVTGAERVIDAGYTAR